MTILVIVESISKCKKIESYLGKDYKCCASFGHIRKFSNGLKSINKNKIIYHHMCYSQKNQNISKI